LAGSCACPTATQPDQRVKEKNNQGVTAPTKN